MVSWRQLQQDPRRWQVVKKRQQLLKKIRQFFVKKGFLEVETPLLAPALLPESYLHIFVSRLENHRGQRQTVYLTPSPELWHKKLLVAGAEKIFEISHRFRNRDLGGHFHNPEFSLLEWYHRQSNYRQTMKDCRDLLRSLWPHGVRYQGHFLSLKHFETIRLSLAFARYAKIQPETLLDEAKLRHWAQRHGYHPHQSWANLYNQIYLQEVEPHLGQKAATIVYDFPAAFAPLARKDPKDPRFRQRFELYLFGIELADGYSELTDPDEQAVNFHQELKRLNRRHRLDQDFLAALRAGLPPSSGVALGIDRLLMIFADQTDINDVILFSAADLFPNLS